MTGAGRLRAPIPLQPAVISAQSACGETRRTDAGGGGIESRVGKVRYITAVSSDVLPFVTSSLLELVSESCP